MLETTAASSEVADLEQAIVAKLRYAVGKDPAHAAVHDWYAATALALRDRVVDRWFATTRRTRSQGHKRVYYLSLEFLIGRLLTDTASNLGLTDVCRAALHKLGVAFDDLPELEPDAALGNGGLGRLAACFMESMATVGLAGYGYGIRYDHGMFRQAIRDGWQVELPENWLDLGNPWEFERPEVACDIKFGGWVEVLDGTHAGGRAAWHPAEQGLAVAYDTPVVGWGGRSVNTLRLWSARSAEPMRLDTFNRGQHVDAFADQLRLTSISRVLYPDDTTPAGQELRLRQEFFFTSASLQDLLRRHLAEHDTLASLPDAAVIQLNDTHPALAVVELLRLLVDEHGMAFAEAWAITRGSLAYTNHTLLPEALETWPVPLFERLLPRHMQLVYALNALHLEAVATDHGASSDLLRRISLIDEQHERRVRMGHLAFLGTRKVNGVSELHGALMRETVFHDLHQLHPDRITHITNGITMRRWLVQSNPGLTGLLRETLGDAWIGNAELLARLRASADDAGFLARYAAVKRQNKSRLATLVVDRLGLRLDPDALFDVQVKRIHEYKRQLLNILETIAHYEAIRAEPGRSWVPRVKIFAGKAAGSYHRAKLIIKLINDVAHKINRDPLMRDRLQVVFLPNYNVSLAESIVPAADLSEQISTAGMEASGTGNMKLALNGALTIGTLDGANVEIRDRVGAENILIFGLTADEVAGYRYAGHHPRAIVDNVPALAAALAAVRSGVFSPDDPHRYVPLVDDLLNYDHFMVTTDFASYTDTQRAADTLYRDQAS
ncbi:MAG TPA: glycogen/starch/alpha-glucan phosphorylase, partial [Reyranella sp.]|nr:glycogen/starch/alpha-glucan phosphorylase [Reyranella sp.]